MTVQKKTKLMASNKEIIALTDFEHVLKRPTMYVGSIEVSEEKLPIVRDNTLVYEFRNISVGFYKLMVEILDNAFDEAKRQKGKMPRVEIQFSTKDNSVTVIDTGGGFLNASKINSKTGVSNVESAFSMLRAGSNFYNEEVSDNLIGTNGVGAALVNMLSEQFIVKTVNDHESYTQTWNKFLTKTPVVAVRTENEPTGTSVKFIPRKDKFPGCNWDKEYIYTQMIFKKFLLRNDPVISNLDFVCKFDDAILNLDVNFLPHEIVKVENKLGQIFIWESYTQAASASFVNGAICSGIHQRILCDHINSVFETTLAGKFYETLIVLNLPPKAVRFGDQNKTRFVTGRSEVQPLLEKAYFGPIKKLLKESPIFEKILTRIADSEREGDVRNLRNKKRASKHKISEKFFPPSKKSVNLFMVEGGSAAGGILQQRDPDIDAVYSLKGKVRNVRRVGDLSQNAEIIDLMNILNLDPENDKMCKFERVVIATDADPDGIGHIASLIINLFSRWFPNVIRQGKLFILQTPLLSVKENGKTKYFYSMKDFEGYNRVKKATGVRYLKGLGSLSIEDWKNVFSDMRLLKITEDSRSDKMIDIAFGSNAMLRKKWLQN